MKGSRRSEGFFLLDTIITVCLVSVMIVTVLAFIGNASKASLKTHSRILESIDEHNRKAVELFEHEIRE